MQTETLLKAQEIWNYLSSFNSIMTSDAIVICCSYDLRVCDHACDLILKGFSNILVISGKHGDFTKHFWSTTEADVFYKRALDNGVSENQIILEQNATNFAENILFSKKLIPNAKTVTFVTKPNSLLRAKLTAEKQWPEIHANVTCPQIVFPDQICNIIGVWGVINEMVGDIDRIQKYPASGFQTVHTLPDKILHNWQYLCNHGFTIHLLPVENIKRI